MAKDRKHRSTGVSGVEQVMERDSQEPLAEGYDSPQNPLGYLLISGGAGLFRRSALLGLSAGRRDGRSMRRVDWFLGLRSVS